MDQVREIEDKALAPRLNRRAAKAFVRNATFSLQKDTSGEAGTAAEEGQAVETSKKFKQSAHTIKVPMGKGRAGSEQTNADVAEGQSLKSGKKMGQSVHTIKIPTMDNIQQVDASVKSGKKFKQSAHSIKFPAPKEPCSRGSEVDVEEVTVVSSGRKLGQSAHTIKIPGKRKKQPDDASLMYNAEKKNKK